MGLQAQEMKKRHGLDGMNGRDELHKHWTARYTRCGRGKGEVADELKLEKENSGGRCARACMEKVWGGVVLS